MTDFRARVDAFLDELFRLEPVLATDVGMHAHDGRWPDVSAAGEHELLAFVDRWEVELRAVGADGGARDADEAVGQRHAQADGDAVDRDLLLLELDAIRFATVELRELDWDALAWVYLLGSGLFPLIAREFAPLDVRLGSVASRLEGMPAVVEVARGRLGSWEGRRASRFHAETAVRQLAGVRELVDDALRVADAVGAVDASVAALLPRLHAAAAAARAALDGFERHLLDVVVPAAEGEGRLGPELFRAKLRRTLRSEHPDPDEIRAEAERAFRDIRAEMVRIAREIWPAWMGETPMPTGGSATDDAAADEAIVRGVLDAIAQEHPAAPDVLDYCRAELGRIEQFCRDRDVVGLADEPLSIEWTPVFLRSGGGAMLIPPGPLDRGEKAFFAVTPIPAEWSAEQAESYLREDNDRMLRLLAIHEGVPGHYLQLSWANRSDSTPRAVFWSGVFAEGWAVYAEQVLMDLGYGADDPALMLTHWKFNLRAVTNALIDVGIHADDMTEAEAMDLMVRGGFQEEAEARAKWDRARLTSTQLVTYFVGHLEMRRLERDRRVQLAAEAGVPDPEKAVGSPGVVGSFGETAGFVYRQHLERVLSFGSPPIPLLRRLVLAE